MRNLSLPPQSHAAASSNGPILLTTPSPVGPMMANQWVHDFAGSSETLNSAAAAAHHHQSPMIPAQDRAHFESAYASAMAQPSLLGT